MLLQTRFYPEYADRFYVGLDLGQKTDPTALSVLRRLAPPEWNPLADCGDCPDGALYHAVGLKRYPLGKPYTEIIDDVAHLCRRLAAEPRPARAPVTVRDARPYDPYDGIRWEDDPAVRRQVRLVVDASGAGLPNVDLLTREFGRYGGVPMVAITITGGLQARQADSRRTARGTYAHWNVPKRELVSQMDSLLQSDRLRVAAGLEEGATLLRELRAFRVRVTESAHETFSAREGEHDDTVLAVTLACWASENITRSRLSFI